MRTYGVYYGHEDAKDGQGSPMHLSSLRAQVVSTANPCPAVWKVQEFLLASAKKGESGGD